MAIQLLANPNIVAHWPTDPFKDRFQLPRTTTRLSKGTPKQTNADGSELEVRTTLAVFTRGRAQTLQNVPALLPMTRTGVSKYSEGQVSRQVHLTLGQCDTGSV